MTQKQTIIVAVAVVAIVAVSVFVYRQYAGGRSESMSSTIQTEKSVTATPRVVVPVEQTVPSNVDDISTAIIDESLADTAALDAEEQGELSEIENDSESVNNLSTSYDENSF
jgi:ABC-type metal ion transport system substrate-binding protein